MENIVKVVDDAVNIFASEIFIDPDGVFIFTPATGRESTSLNLARDGTIHSLSRTINATVDVQAQKTYGIGILLNTRGGEKLFTDPADSGTFRFTDLQGVEFESSSNRFLRSVVEPLEIPIPLWLLPCLIGSIIVIHRLQRRAFS